MVFGKSEIGTVISGVFMIIFTGKNGDIPKKAKYMVKGPTEKVELDMEGY